MSAAFYLGVDVSKDSLAVALKETLTGNTLWANKSIHNTEKGFSMLAETVLKKTRNQGYGDSCAIAIGMESTGIYGERLAYYFSEKSAAGFSVYILNPAAVRSFAKSAMTKNKNDATDAHVIASYMSVAIPQNIVSPWTAPSKTSDFLNSMSKRREELVRMRAIELNRVEKLKNKVNPHEEIFESVNKLIAYLSEEIKCVEKKIETHIIENPDIKNDLELMRSIPGIGTVASVIIYGETGGLRNFKNAKQLTAFAGLAPEEFSSGSSVYKKARISKKGNARIRRVLYLCAMAGIRYNSAIKDFYTRLTSAGKSRKIAIVACMRKLLHIIWGVIKHSKAFVSGYSV